MEADNSFIFLGLAAPLVSLLAALGGAYFTKLARKSRMASLDAVAAEMFKTLEKQPVRQARRSRQNPTAAG